MHFGHWRHYDWVAGALLIMIGVTILFLYREYRPARPLRIFQIATLAGVFVIGGLLFIPAVPRLVTAARQLVISRAPTETSGPFPVTTARYRTRLRC